MTSIFERLAFFVSELDLPYSEVWSDQIGCHNSIFFFFLNPKRREDSSARAHSHSPFWSSHVALSTSVFSLM